MNKTITSCMMLLGLCAMTTPVLAGEDETFMDWSYASGLDPKPRPNQMTQETIVEEVAPDTMASSGYDASIFATSEIGNVDNQTTVDMNELNSTKQYTNTTYTMTRSGNIQGMDVYSDSTTNNGIMTGVQNSAQGYTTNAQVVQPTIQQTAAAGTIVMPQYYQVPMNTIQTPAEVHHINNPIKVQYPVTKQYPISMQYPVTIQKEITVQRPVVVQQPIVVQRPIVMQQPVMVQHKPLMVQNKPVMVQQQPTVVQKQPIVVNAPAQPFMPTPPCMAQKVHQPMPMNLPQGVPATGTFTGMATMPTCSACYPTRY